MKLSTPSGRMLGIAKEIYIRGYFHSTKKSISDSILAILNFDYSAETILKAILLDKKIPIERKSGGYRPFDELILEIKTHFPNINYLNEIVSLHKLRNDVQHHCNIPSDNEVSRHNTTIRLFFDEVCQNIYENSMSYNAISLAQFIDSVNEKFILEKMEAAYQKGDYSTSIRYCKRAAIYHTMLIRSSIEAPLAKTRTFNSYEFNDELVNAIKETNDTVNWLVNKLCLREHYEPINALLNGLLQKHYFYYYKGDIDQEENNGDKAEKSRNLIYEFITSTQDLILKKDLEIPFIYDFVVLEENNKNFLRLGIVSLSDLKSVQIGFAGLDGGSNSLEINAPIQRGLNLVPIVVKNSDKYNFYCEVTNNADEEDSARTTPQ